MGPEHAHLLVGVELWSEVVKLCENFFEENSATDRNSAADRKSATDRNTAADRNSAEKETQLPRLLARTRDETAVEKSSAHVDSENSATDRLTAVDRKSASDRNSAIDRYSSVESFAGTLVGGLEVDGEVGLEQLTQVTGGLPAEQQTGSET